MTLSDGHAALERDLLLYAAMLAGMMFRVVWDQLELSRQRSARATRTTPLKPRFGIWDFVYPALPSLALFQSVLWLAETRALSLQLFLLSFQNGFLWHALLARTKSSAEGPAGKGVVAKLGLACALIFPLLAQAAPNPPMFVDAMPDFNSAVLGSDGKTVWVAAGNGLIYTSIDGGVHWNWIDIPGTGAPLLGLYFNCKVPDCSPSRVSLSRSSIDHFTDCGGGLCPLFSAWARRRTASPGNDDRRTTGVGRFNHQRRPPVRTCVDGRHGLLRAVSPSRRLT